jgi:uncharacterized membrane protein YczE
MTKRLLKLNIGLVLYALGIFLTLQANLGVSPWDALHQGLAKLTGISFGKMSIGVGIIILIINACFKEKIGIGTILNILVIGSLIDLFYEIKLVPLMTSFSGGLLFLLLGMFIIAFATYFYIDAGLGAGPRDGLMIVMVRITNKPVGIIRSTIEALVAIGGFLLGGQIGIGTIILAIGIGPVVQLVFKLLNFKIETIQHQYLFANS